MLGFGAIAIGGKKSLRKMLNLWQVDVQEATWGPVNDLLLEIWIVPRNTPSTSVFDRFIKNARNGRIVSLTRIRDIKRIAPRGKRISPGIAVSK